MEKDDEMDAIVGILNETNSPSTIKAGGSRVYKKAKLTAPTIAGLRSPFLNERIEKYNKAYDRLVKIAEEMNDSKDEEKSVISGINEYNRQAQKLTKLKVEILAFDDVFNSKIRLDQPGIKAIRVPNILLKAFNNFSIVSSKTNEDVEDDDNITEVAKSVISEHENELTIDITNLEKVSAVASEIEDKKVEDNSLIDRVNDILNSNKVEYGLSNFSIYKQDEEKESVYKLSNFSIEKQDEEKENIYKLSNSSIEKQDEEKESVYELSNFSIEKQDEEKENVYKLSNFSIEKPKSNYKLSNLLSNIFNKKEKYVNKTEFESSDELISLITAESTLFKAIKSVYDNNYLVQKINRDDVKNLDFIKEGQKLCVMHNNLVVDTSSDPNLIHLVMLSNSWARNCSFGKKEKEVFNKILKGKEISDEEFEKIGFPKEKAKRTSLYFKGANECFKNLRKGITKYKLSSFGDEISEIEVRKKSKKDVYGLSNFNPSKYQKDELPPFDPNKWLNAIISGDIDKDGTSIYGLYNYKLNEPQLKENCINEIKNEEQIPCEELEDISEEKSKEYQRLEKMFVNNDIALRFLTEEIKNPSTGEPMYTTDDVVKSCEDANTNPLCLAIAIFQNLDRKLKNDILNRFTTKYTVLSGDLK